MDFIKMLPFVTTRIEVSYHGGKTEATGTGFFFAFDFKHDEQDSYCPVLITNRHVVKNAQKITIHITTKHCGKPAIGQCRTFSIPLTHHNVIFHPCNTVDLAAVILAPVIVPYVDSLFIPYFRKSDIATDTDMEHINILHDIIMVGYPNGIMDKVNYMPVFRKGITATNPAIDYNGQKHFLIDAACFPGSSGSPVMSYEDGLVHDDDGNFTVGYGIKLIGIQSATFLHNSRGEIVPIEIPTQIIPGVITSIPNNLGIVIKASCILDFESFIPR